MSSKDELRQKIRVLGDIYTAYYDYENTCKREALGFFLDGGGFIDGAVAGRGAYPAGDDKSLSHIRMLYEGKIQLFKHELQRIHALLDHVADARIRRLRVKVPALSLPDGS